MRVLSFLLLSCLAVIVLAETPASSSTGAAVTITNPPLGSVENAPKSTPGRHCSLRIGCGDCLAINYCAWSPSQDKCLDKHKATPKDDVIFTCDKDECAKHMGKPVDKRPVEHVQATIVNARGRRVIAEAQAVHKLHHVKQHFAQEAKHLAGRSFPRTSSDDSHVVIKPGQRRMIFSSDNNAPIIRGEAEKRHRQYLRERRQHRHEVLRKEACEAARGCGVRKPHKKQYARPEYYPDVRANRTTRIAQFHADHLDHDAELRRKLTELRERADYTLNHRSGMISAKRRRIQELLDQVSSHLRDVNQQARQIDGDEALYQRIHSQVKALEEKVIYTCDAPNSSFLETPALVEVSSDSDSEVDSDSEIEAGIATEASSTAEAEMTNEQEIDSAAEAEVAAEDAEAVEAGAYSYSEADVATQAENEVAAEEAAEQQDFAAAEQQGQAESTVESELQNNGELSAEENEQRLEQLNAYADYKDPIQMN